MAKVLVTGASGFIGFHLVRALAAQGHEVSCLARKPSNLDRLAGLAFRRMDGDVRDAGSLARAIAGQDAVYHLAGLVKATRVEHLYQVNSEGTANVARACAAAVTPPVLLAVSSLAAMGPSTPDRPRLESDPPAPVSHYGRSKLAGELEARKWARQMPITILRPPVVFGEGDMATFEMFRPIARCGVHVLPTWTTHWLSLIHADDLADSMILAAQRGRRIVCHPADGAATAQGCYFVAAERDLAFAEIGRMMGAALGRKRTHVLRTGTVIVWTLALLATAVSRLSGQPWYFSSDKAREARAGSWTCSPAAAARDLQFSVRKPLEERFRQTANWYQEHGWL
jgi:dihydroflavonol-4-reductase